MIKKRLVILFILLIFYVHYILFYLLTSQRNVIISDLKANCRIPYKLPEWLLFIYAIKYDNYFFQLFKYRIRNSKFLILLPERNTTNFFINRDTIIEAPVRYDHPYSTIINAKFIGYNLRIKNNVTIGNSNDDENNRPIIGNNVYIGVGAIIIGKIKVGNNVVIGAGSVIVKDIPDNAIVVGNPGRVIKFKSLHNEKI